MLDRARYQRTFSHLHPTRAVKWEDFAGLKHPKKAGLPLRRLLTAAAVLCLLAALSAAVAVNLLGLHDLLLPQKQKVNVIDPETGVMVPGKTHEVDTVSLSGYMDSPESKALAEWQAFLDGYDQNGTILAKVGNTIDQTLFAKYGCYCVYTQEMGDKLEEIAAKYGLKLHTQSIDLCAHPEALGPLADFAKDAKETYWTYMYEDGSCHFDGFACVEGLGLVDVQFQRTAKGWFNDVTLNIGDAADYEQWNYKTASGVKVVLALGPEKSLIFADLPDCFASFNVFQGTESQMTRRRLEAVAERYDFSKLSPVAPPELLPEPHTIVPPEEWTDPKTAYAKVLRELLYGGTLPDGSAIDSAWDGGLSKDQFAICDVDFDGEDELVLLHTASCTAGMAGYVLDFDPTYTGDGDPVSIQMSEFPALTFYENGAVKAEWSYNQTWGELWPYTLYAYEPVSDSYYQIASVYAADKEVLEQVGRGEEYPDEVDKSGTGRVYYVSFPNGSGAEPAGERVWDSEEYFSWLDSVLGRAQALDLPYWDLTEENIAAALGGSAPVQTVPPEGMPKG